ncbi:hypothetical protein M0805_008672 [Coniferiporia weirii]|nr:hypothetical protein M0805_008672 [Coniferiporia weirii]
MDYKVLPLASPPNTQALTSKTFKPPPLDGSLTIPGIYDWHLENTPDHPLFVYSDAQGHQHTITWPVAVKAIHRAAHVVHSRVGRDRGVDELHPPVVAILSSTDTITYFTVLAGIFRAGLTAFPISPRNSPTAVAHLIRKTKVTHILVGHEQASRTLSDMTLELLNNDGEGKPRTSLMPSYEEIYTSDAEFKPFPLVKPDLDSIVLYLHSSGSTAFPKPIPWTHYRFLLFGWIPYFGERDMCGVRFACHSIPMYHGLGVMQTCWTAISGITLTAFQPSNPPIIPGPDNVFKESMETQSDLILCVPSFLESWGRNSEYVARLRKIDGVVFGGGPLNKKVGDALARQGISIFILYGCTEVGIVSPILPKEAGMDWEYFRIAGNINPKFVPSGGGNYELIIVPHKYEVPNVFNTKVDGKDAYATSDLLTPHPTKPGYWKVYGRADDQLMHSTGEKTNPGPLESILNQDPHVQAAVMFGRGRFNAGVLVDPRPEFKFDPSDTAALTEFRQKIWPTVEHMNEYAPQHSRIFKEMIIVASPSKPFSYTAKNTARRQFTIDDYEEEIEAVYNVVSESTQSDIPLPPSWEVPHTLDFVRLVLEKVMKRTIAVDVDIFQNGCDSLQATWIRNTLLNALRVSTEVDVRTVPINFVYHNPSIGALAAYVSELTCSPGGTSDQQHVQRKVDKMHALVTKYSEGFPKHVPTDALPSDGDVVLVTGTTGALGAILLIELLSSPTVKRVYALNRRGGELLLRQQAALEERGLDKSLLDDPKCALLEGSLNEENFGLGVDTFEEVRMTLTHIIHNAYPVNFNMSLTSFKPSIAGLRRLIDMALSSPLRSPPRLLFTGSISVLRQNPSKGPVKEEFVEAASAVGAGYSESKWVCEELLSVASQKTPLESVIVRIGQMSGMNTNGCWNTKEWVPAMFKSSITLGCLPSLGQQTVSWIAIDTAARAVAEMRDSPVQVLHLAHPNPDTWASLFGPVSADLGIPLVPYAEWLARIEGSRRTGSSANADVDAEARANPAGLIAEFFRGAAHVGQQDGEAMGLKRLALDGALRVSQTMRDAGAEPLSVESVRKWIVYWKKIGFI